jgi:hypothetical protein
MLGPRRSGGGGVAAALAVVAAGVCGLCLLFVAALGGITGFGALGGSCGPAQTVGATEYGGPGDPSSDTVGASGVDLLTHPNSFAELGGTGFATATALGGLAYGTALDISAGGRSVIAQKEDIGLGGGAIDGHPRVIDLWWRLAQALGIPYEHGRWSGTVQIEALSTDCLQAAGARGVGATGGGAAGGGVAGVGVAGVGAAGSGTGADGQLILAGGPRATLLAGGAAAAPASAPASVKGIIAAGNQIAGTPYLYGGGHGSPLNLIAAYYDCSSSVSHLLWGGGLLSADGDLVSSEYESWGLPGPGRWVTIYANADHVFMYVAGMRWDTWNAAGAGDGDTGIGWHPLVRGDQGFVVRHPPGL